MNGPGSPSSPYFPIIMMLFLWSFWLFKVNFLVDSLGNIYLKILALENSLWLNIKFLAHISFLEHFKGGMPLSSSIKKC